MSLIVDGDGYLKVEIEPKLTHKGDLLTFTTEEVRLPVGEDGEVLVAASGSEYGLEWANVSGTGGTSNHSELNELDYASSGHTGFASSAQLTSVSNTVDTNTSNISTLTSDLSTVSGLVDTNTSGIATNASGIANNASAIGLNTTHRTSDGTDHTYIDQDVTSTSSPNFTEVSADGIKFDTSTAPTLTPEGTVWWNGDEYTLNVQTGLGPTLQVGQEFMTLVYNESGSTISDGAIVHSVSATTQGSVNVPTIELAKADKWESCNGCMLISTMEISNNSLGFVSRIGKIRGIDTSSFSAGDKMYLSADTAGVITNVRPSSPNFPISLGRILNSSAGEGEVYLSAKGTFKDIYFDAFDGTALEKFTFTVSSNGSVITGSLVNKADSGRDIVLNFSSGFYTLDTTPAATVTLTAGTDTNPQINYVYIPISTKTLTTNTSGFPDEEHISIGTVYCQSAASVQTYDVLKNHNWNDYVKAVGDGGYIQNIARAIREKIQATWKAGCEGSATITTNVGSADNVNVATTAGTVMQMHYQTISAMDTDDGDSIYIVNDNTTAFKRVTDLNGELTDAEGNSMSGNTFSLVVWAVANSGGEPPQLMCNLPTESYDTGGFFNPIDLAEAIKDVYGYAVYDIPDAFQGTGFLIARFTFTHDTASGGTWTLEDTEDLRGKLPNISAGGAAGGSGVTSWLGLIDTPSSYNSQANKFPTVNVGETGLEFVELTASEITDFDTEVSNNASVVANTAKISYTDAATVSGNTADIATVSGRVDTNTANITTNSGNVSTLSGTIDTHISNTANPHSTTFSGLGDTPTTTSGNDGQYLQYTTVSGLQWATVSGGGGGTAGELELGSILTTTSTYKGTTMTVQVDDASTTFGDALYQASDFNYERCDADADTTMPCRAIALEAGSGSKKVLLYGQICNTSWDWSAGTVWVSLTTGELTQTMPSGTGDQVQEVGYALSADTFMFAPVSIIAEVE